jgi:hypothetical protein
MRYNVMVLVVLAACGRHSEHTYRYGSDGINGKDGSNGHSSLLATTSFSGVSGSCTNGGIVVLSGLDSNDSGILDSEDSNLVSSVVCNGSNGIDGTNGSNGLDAVPSPWTPVSILNPCGVNGSYDEVLLKLYNGQVMASFSQNSNGLNTRFSLLLPNVGYQTTDSYMCYFMIDINGNLYNEHH